MTANHPNTIRIRFGHRLAAALAIAIGVSSGSAQAQAVTAWRDTASQAPAFAEARLLGNADASQPLSIAIVLKPRNLDLLKSFIQDLYRPGSPSFHQWMSGQETLNYFSPTKEQAQAVADYLRQQGFEQIEIAPNRLVITAQGKAADAMRAFHTSLGRFTWRGHVGIANLQDIQVPATLPQIAHVLGLQTLQQAHTRSLPADALRKVADGKATPAYGTSGNGRPYYYPDEFASAYHAGNTPTGGQTPVAIIGWGSMSSAIKDLQQFEKARGLPAVPTKIVKIGGSSSDNSGEGEWAMDAQAIVGISGGVKSLSFYTASNASDSTLLQTINRVVGDNIAKVINMSWSIDCEDSDTGWADSAFQLGVAQGQTFANSSGDNGAYPCGGGASGVPNGSYGPQLGVGYPSSSPYVVSVGGTTLHTTSNDGYLSESAWAYGGGGVSRYEAKPSWQSALPGNYRRLPDLAFDADWDNSAIAYYMHAGTSSAGWYLNGGTSLAAPLFVGAWARLESAHANQLGFAAPAIYRYASSLPLHDVTQGSDGYYQAASGWDNATGLGSFDIQAVNDFIGQNPGFIQATHP